MIKNLKKVISTLAAVAILATSASAFAVSFPDVDESASYAGAVDALTTLGVVNGDDNGKFNPENTVTRAEFAKMVVEALGAGNEAASSADTKFVDAKGHWAAGYIEVGVAKEFINGYDEKTFGPDDQVTYAQAVKMLVAAIGYETYASMQGGWPSGYLAYGSTLDIIAGVTGVGNDTALTRAQCAVLVYNTLKAPICKVDGYEQNYKGEWVPNLEEMNGEGKNWQSLLTSKHDAFVVRGRAMSANKKEATVSFQVEAAENFDGVYVTGAAYAVGNSMVAYPERDMNVGTTNAADMLFTYSEAIVQKDKDTSEYTLVSITPYGAASTVEFATKDLDDKTAAAEIEVKRAGTTKTTKYKLEDNAKLYINGEKVTVTTGEGEAAVTSDKYSDTKDLAIANVAYAATNLNGVVTLVDSTDVGSTATNGYYDYVMVTYYATTKVLSVDADEDEVVVDTMDGQISWLLDESDEKVITFTKDGAEIAYTDLKKDDVLSIAYDIVNEESFEDADVLDILVSDKVVSGVATGKSTSKTPNTLIVDGTTYEIKGNADDYNLGVELGLSLDAFGYVAYIEEGVANKKLGIVSGMYKAASGEYNVTIVTADGDVEKHTTNKANYKAIANALGADLEDSEVDAYKIEKSEITPEEAVIEYKITSGEIKLATGVTSAEPATHGGVDQEYTASLEMLGRYAISETATKVLSVENYFNGTGSIGVMSVADLEDEGKYDAYMYNANSDDVYGLVLITGGLADLRPTSTLAVVMSSGVTTTVNDETVEVVTVAANGEEDVEVYFEGDVDFAEGTIIMYTVGTEGYVESENGYEVVKAPAATMYTDVFADAVTVFTATAGGAVADTDADGIYSLNINGDEDDDKVEIYYGPVFTATDKTIKIFTKQTGTKSSMVDDVETFAIGNANTYVYNAEKNTGDGLSVSTGMVAQDKVFLEKLIDAEDKTLVDWSQRTAKKVSPRLAFVRVVDNVVTDVVYYRAK